MIGSVSATESNGMDNDRQKVSCLKRAVDGDGRMPVDREVVEFVELSLVLGVVVADGDVCIPIIIR